MSRPRGPDGMTDFAGLRRIQMFVSEYYIHREHRSPTEHEKRLIAEALEGYLLGEDWLLGPAKDRVIIILDGLAHLSRLLPLAAQPTARWIGHCVIDLAARLERREEANDIMQEHLAMMSMTVNRLSDQLGARTPSSREVVQPQ